MTAPTGALLGVILWLIVTALGLPAMMGRFWVSYIPVFLILGAFSFAWPFGRRFLWTTTLVLTGFLALIAYTPLMRAPMQAWIRDDAIPLTPLDAVVALSADMTDDGILGPDATGRLLDALRLVKQNNAPLLLTTRYSRPSLHRRLTPDSGQRRLVSLAGLESRWRILPDVKTTRDEASRAWALLGASHSHIAVVTSPLHTRRACAVFEAAGFTVTCVAAESLRWARRSLDEVSDRVLAFEEYIYERAGMVKYERMGWVKAGS